MELFKNFATTTLTAGINSTVTTIPVTDASVFPTIVDPDDQFRLRIDNEAMVCTAVNLISNQLTVVRGTDLSTASAHANASRIDHPLTAGALAQFRIDTRIAVNDANITAKRAGRLILPNDGFRLTRDNGTNLADVGPYWKMNPFNDLTSWSWFNQGGAFYDTSKGFFFMECPPSGGDLHRGIQRSMPTPPFKLRTYIIPMFFSINYSSCGIQLFESSTGKAESLHYIHSTNGNIEQNKWNSRTSYNGTRANCNPSQGFTTPHWLQIYHDGTNIAYQVSWDGANWYTLSSQSKTDFFSSGPDTIAVYCSAVNDDWKVQMSVFHLDIL